MRGSRHRSHPPLQPARGQRQRLQLPRDLCRLKRPLRHFPQEGCTNFRQKARAEWLATPERRQKRPTLGCPFERNGRIGGQSGRGGHYIRKRNGSGSSLCRRTRKAVNLPVRCLSSNRVRFLCRFSDQIYVTGHPATANCGWWSESPRAFSSDPSRCSDRL